MSGKYSINKQWFESRAPAEEGCEIGAGSELPAPTGSAATVEGLIMRLASQGLLPCAHNLNIWQHADGSGWGVAVESAYHEDISGHGDTLYAALRELMKACNRGADVPPNDKLSESGGDKPTT